MLKYNVNLIGKTVLVTGTAGFIGSNLSMKLLKEIENVKVIGIDNMSDYYDVCIKENRLKSLEHHINFVFVKGNIADKALITDVFSKYHPEA